MTEAEELELIEIELEMRRRGGSQPEAAAAPAPAAQAPLFGNPVSQTERSTVTGYTASEAQQRGEAGTARLKEAAPTAIRVGVPLAAAPFTGGASLLAGAAFMGTAAGLGEALAQGVEGTNRPGAVLGATITGMLPGGVARGVPGGVLGRTAATSMSLAGQGVLQKAIETGVDEGRLPTQSEAIESAVAPAVLGSAVGVAGAVKTGGRAIVSHLSDMQARFAKIGERPTLGVALPELFGQTERNIIERAATGDIAQRVENMKRGVTSRITSEIGEAPEKAEVVGMFKGELGRVTEARESLNKLSASAQQANAAADEAAKAYQQATKARTSAAAGVADSPELKQAMASAAAASDQAFNTNLQSIVENARAVAAKGAGIAGVGIDPATARNELAEGVFKPLHGAFRKKQDELYGLVGDDALNANVFDTKAIDRTIGEVAKEIYGGVPRVANSAMARVRGILDEVREPNQAGISINALRAAKEELYSASKAETNQNTKRLLSKVAASITDTINDQAIAKLGAERGQAFLAANDFTRKNAPLFNNDSVWDFFYGKPTDAAVSGVVGDILKAGKNADVYTSLRAAVDGVRGVDTALADAAESTLKAQVRQSLLYRHGADATGELKADAAGLLGDLEKLSRVSGTLEELGLGDRRKLNELQVLFAKYDSAGKLTAKEWDTLLSQPSVGDAGSRLATSLSMEQLVAARDTQNKLILAANLKGAGKQAQAAKLYNAALENVRKAGGNVTEAQRKYDSLTANPVAVALNNPNLSGEGYQALESALFDPAAGKLTNANVRDIMGALNRGGKKYEDVASALRQRYIADRIAKWESSAGSGSQNLDSLAMFFGPPGVDRASELERARAVLSTEQFNRLRNLGGIARDMQRAGHISKSPISTPTQTLPAVGVMRRAIDSAHYFAKRQQYNLAALVLDRPDLASKLSTRATLTAADLVSSLGAQKAILAINRNPGLLHDLSKQPEQGQ